MRPRKHPLHFKVAPGPHSRPEHVQLAIQAHDLSRAECQFVRGIVTDNYMESENYKLRQPTGAFLQGYQEPMHDEDENEWDGWVLIEFWSQNRIAIDKFVAHLNKKIAEEEFDD